MLLFEMGLSQLMIRLLNCLVGWLRLQETAVSFGVLLWTCNAPRALHAAQFYGSPQKEELYVFATLLRGILEVLRSQRKVHVTQIRFAAQSRHMDFRVNKQCPQLLWQLPHKLLVWTRRLCCTLALQCAHPEAGAIERERGSTCHRAPST